jgi:hypothetical protein
MAPAGIETATFRFLAQHLNHCATAVPTTPDVPRIIYETFCRERIGHKPEVSIRRYQDNSILHILKHSNF